MTINMEPIRMGYCKCVAQSEKAICVIGLKTVKGKTNSEIHNVLPMTVWIPQSQVHADSEVWMNGQSGELVVTGYWAEKKRWI